MMEVVKLDFVVLGGQKCGSTFLQSILEIHPEIEMLPGETASLEDPDYLNGGKEKLVNMLREKNRSKIIGLKRPNYLTKPEVLPRLIELNPNVKLIVILRNPFDRLRSAYFHYLNMGFIPVKPINIGLANILAGKLQKEYPRREEILEVGLYHKHLENYLRYFGDNIKIFLMDDLKSKQNQVISECYKFLGIDDMYMPPQKILKGRPQKVNYSLFRARVTRLMNPIRYKYWNNHTRIDRKKLYLHTAIIVILIRTIDVLLSKVIANNKPQFSRQLYSDLASFYSADIEHLASLINRDLSEWK